MIVAKSSIVIKRLRTDNGGEYKYIQMKSLCNKLKIAQEFTLAYNSEQNGLAERFHRTLVEMIRCILKDCGMEKKYWTDELLTCAI